MSAVIDSLARNLQERVLKAESEVERLRVVIIAALAELEKGQDVEAVLILKAAILRE